VDFDDFRIAEKEPQPPVDLATANSHPIPPFDPARLQALLDDIKRDPYRGKSPPKIVIKLDDLRPANGGVHARWLKVADFAKSRNIKVAFGIIANSMEADCPQFVQWVKEKNASGMIEFWNHGYDHAGDTKIMEFSGQPYEHQKEHMTKANQLAREKLGFPFVSFGAPFNATDASTVQVLSEDPDIKVWMYGDSKNPAGKVVLRRCIVNIETPTLIPNYAAFVEGYAHNRGAAYFVMQGHPGGWSDDRYEQFTKEVDFLISQKADFVLPREFLDPPATAAAH
jgi:predicted deacetylase